MKARLKVLHILWSGTSGGAERFVRDITIYSDKERFEHAVCCLSEKGWISDEIVKTGSKVYCLRMKNGFSVISGMRFLGVLREFRPDIINNHNRNYLVNILIKLFSRARKIYFEHGGVLVGNNPKREIIFYNFIGNIYDLILTNSNYAKDTIEKLTKVDPKRIKMFYIGIDIQKYNIVSNKERLKIQLGIPKENKVIGIVGRLEEQKGIDDFIKVASEINKLGDKFSFLVVGGGSKRAFLEKMALDLGAGIRFLGDRNDVPVLLGIFDIFLFTSKWEPFGIVILEALASRVPVVGFAVPGAKEIIERGGGGMLIEGRDHRELAKAVINLLEDKENYNRIAEEGYKNASENFNIKTNIKNLEKEYILIL